ncbi:MAG: hypothetical protein GY699_10410 [Desulfobacteraceae bacterium]|nr:hypothetical protein [Desulfobacteraceae bacterium]
MWKKTTRPPQYFVYLILILFLITGFTEAKAVEPQVSAGSGVTLGLKSDGSLVGSGNYVTNWTDLIQVSAGSGHIVGLKSDGTLEASGSNSYSAVAVAKSWADIVQVSVGFFFIVGLKSDGTVVGSGKNTDGRRSVEDWTDIIQVSAGDYHTAALKSDGSVVATGQSFYGQLDTGTWTNIIQVSVGAVHTLGLKTDGTLATTGRNNFGQLNVNSWTDIIQVAASSYHTIGLKSDGTVVAVGSDSYGQLDVSAWTDIIQVATSNGHTVGLKANGTVVAVGYNYFGQCDLSDWSLEEHCDGIDNNGDGLLGPTEIDNDSDGYIECAMVPGQWQGDPGVAGGGDLDDSDPSIYPGAPELCDGNDNDQDGNLLEEEMDNDSDGYIECAIDSGGWDGSSSVIGGNDLDDNDSNVYPGAPELCDGIDNDQDGHLPETEIDNDEDGYIECAIDPGGWKGDPDVVGGLDTNDQDDSVFPALVIPMVCAEYTFTVGLKANGNILFAGSNNFGPIPTINRWMNITQIDASAIHVVGLKSDGTVIAEGNSDDGKLDVGDWSDIVQVSAGGEHTVGLRSNGTVLIAGEDINYHFDLVRAWTDIVQVSAGAGFTVGLKQDGSVVGAGYHEDGRRDVYLWTDIVQITTGINHTVGLKADGTVLTAGSAALDEWANIIQVAAGYYSTMGILSDHTVVSSGLNADNQLSVSSWVNIIQTASGYNFTVGLKADGSVIAVGDNSYGQCNTEDWYLGPIDYDNDGYTFDQDCNDFDNTAYPEAPELCDGILNNCNGSLLPGEIDIDGDGYVECTIDSGGWDGDLAVLGGNDNDNDDPSVYPGAPELCDGIDNNQDGVLLDIEIDNDGDGYVEGPIDSGGWDGDPAVLGGDDSNDNDPNIYSGAPELCDNIDNDQNGLIDDNPACTLDIKFSDDFEGPDLNSAFWELNQEDGDLEQSNGQLILSLPPSSSSEEEGIRTNCVFVGNFDVIVDFDLLESQMAGNSLNLRLFAHEKDNPTEMSISRVDNGYYVEFGGITHGISVADLNGKLKMIRRGTRLWAYYHDGADFVEICSGEGSGGPVHFHIDLSAFPDNSTTGGQIAYDNFIVKSEKAYCPDSNSEPFSNSVESFSIDENLPGSVVDEFNDGILWENIKGTAIEENGVLTLSDPGQVETDLSDFYFEVEQYSTAITSNPAFAVADDQGDFSSESRWIQPVVSLNHAIIMSLYFGHASSWEQKMIEVGIINLGPIVANNFGIPEGLNIFFHYEDDFSDTEQVHIIPIIQENITDDAIFGIHFNDTTDQFSASYSLDGGTTSISIGAPFYSDLSEGIFNAWTLSAVTFEHQARCKEDFDKDSDIDGEDLVDFIIDNQGVSIEEFAAQFGQTNCQ